jgi:phage shock protein A
VGKFTGYVKTWFGMKAEEVKDPEVEIEQAIQEAQKRDQELRNQAAKVLANRTQIAQEVEESAGDVAEAKELAKQALLKADAAAKAGNAADAEKWNKVASQIAIKLTAAQTNYDMMSKQLVTAQAQAEAAKQAVQNNAMAVQELSAKRIELLGQLQAAKMQESVNKAMTQMNASVGSDAPSFEEVENKIQARMAQASASAELASATDPNVAIAELKQSTMTLKADTALDSLRAELGLGDAPALAAPATGQLAPPPPPPPA